jgi:hypothetical protein
MPWRRDSRDLPGIIFLCLAGLAGVPCNPILILTVIGELLLLSFTLTAFGVMMAARITQIQAFMALTRLDPITYACTRCGTRCSAI